MNHSIDEIVAVCKREILHCVRDPDVIIYTLLCPFLFCPLIAIGGSEFVLWQTGTHEHSVLKLALDKDKVKDEGLIRAAFKDKKGIAIVDSTAMRADLASGKIDAIISQDNKSRLFVESRSTARLMWKVDAALDAARNQILADSLKAKGLPESALKVFTEKSENVSSFNNLSVPKANTAFNLFDALIAMGMLALSTGALYPSVLIFAEEREKRTIETTLLLPIGRMALLAGKLSATMFLCLIVLGENLIGSIPSLAFCSSQSSGAIAWLIPLYSSMEWLFVAVASTLLSLSILVLYCLSTVMLTFGTKSFRQAQTIASLPMTYGMLMAAASALPTLKLSQRTVLIPLLNLLLSLKALANGHLAPALVIEALVESAALIALEFWILSIMIKQEEFLLSNRSWNWADIFARRTT